MKTNLLLILLICFAFQGFAQTKVNEKQALRKSHIDFTKEYLWFYMSGTIEIDGHIIKDTIIYTANLEGITIKDLKGIEYVCRKCSKKGCHIIHLVKKESDIIIGNDRLFFNSHQYNELPNNSLIPNNFILD